MRVSTSKRMRSLERSFASIVEASTDVATDDEHDPEGHTIAWERQQIAALIQESRSTLDEFEGAKRRLDAGSYGTCTVCAGEISAARLDALPATPNCVDCAR